MRTKPTFYFARHTATEKFSGTGSLRGPRNTELPIWLAPWACFWEVLGLILYQPQGPFWSIRGDAERTALPS